MRCERTLRKLQLLDSRRVAVFVTPGNLWKHHVYIFIGRRCRRETAGFLTKFKLLNICYMLNEGRSDKIAVRRNTATEVMDAASTNCTSAFCVGVFNWNFHTCLSMRTLSSVAYCCIYFDTDPMRFLSVRCGVSSHHTIDLLCERIR